MISPSELQDLKAQLRQLVVKDLEQTLAVLKEALPADTPRMGEVLTLEGQYHTYKRDQLRQTLSTENDQLIGNQIRAQLVDLISALTLADFDPVRASVTFAPARRRMRYLWLALIVGGGLALAFYWSQQTEAPGWFPLPDNKSGHLLYQIPEMMELHKEEICLMRIAFDSAELVQQLSLDQVKVENIQTSEKMRVELVAAAVDPAFRIRNILDKEQFITEDEYTEWQFGVTPLKEGTYPLTLKVSVMKKVGEEYVPRNLAFSKQVEIVASPLARSEASFVNTGQIVSEKSGEQMVHSIDEEREVYESLLAYADRFEVNKADSWEETLASYNSAERKEMLDQLLTEKAKSLILLFPYNSATPIYRPGNEDPLAALLQQWRTKPDTILVVGHTDDLGDTAYNYALGLRRAQAVKQLLRQQGIAPERIRLESKGETEPLTPNKEEADRAQNRRVEIRLGY